MTHEQYERDYAELELGDLEAELHAVHKQISGMHEVIREAYLELDVYQAHRTAIVVELGKRGICSTTQLTLVKETR